MIRCDDIFVDSDVHQFEKICQIIRRYEFEHIIGVTPLGEGKCFWTDQNGVGNLLLKMSFLTKYGFFTNYWIKKMTGQKCISNNTQLYGFLKSEFDKYGTNLALHGLHHYRYTNLSRNDVYEELSTGIILLEQLFKIRVKIFVPPFNSWNERIELVCNSLKLTIDKCKTWFDILIKNMDNSQIEQLAKQQSSSPEVYYHPHRIVNLGKFDFYLRNRRKYLV
jgi:hypothetical protein